MILPGSCTTVYDFFCFCINMFFEYQVNNESWISQPQMTSSFLTMISSRLTTSTSTVPTSFAPVNKQEHNNDNNNRSMNQNDNLYISHLINDCYWEGGGGGVGINSNIMEALRNHLRCFIEVRKLTGLELTTSH